jgi:RHS repeat-associated protein
MQQRRRGGFEYTSFGSTVKERTTSFTQKYRFGFNNQEQEIELGEYYSFEYRVHDARIGRFLSVDPLSDEYPWNSVYAFAENRVIDGRDLEGSEWQPVGKDGNNLPIGDKGITGYKWAGYERQTGFTNANNGTQAETWVAKEGTLANPPPIKMGNYTYQWSSDPNSRSGNVYMKWNGGTKNPSRPLDGKNIELKLQQQDNGTTTAHYRSGPSAPAYGFTPTAKNEWKPLNAVNKICVIPNGSYIKTDGKVDVTGMRASQMALRANLQESGSLAGSQEPDVVKTKYRSEALGDPLEPIYSLLVPEVGLLQLGGLGLKVASTAKTSRGLWTLTKEGASTIKNHKTWGNMYKSKSDGLWWAADRTGHGPSKYKVFKETNKGLEWFKDADEFGDFIINKHKSPTGTFIPWAQLGTVK